MDTREAVFMVDFVGNPYIFGEHGGSRIYGEPGGGTVFMVNRRGRLYMWWTP